MGQTWAMPILNDFGAWDSGLRARRCAAAVVAVGCLVVAGCSGVPAQTAAIPTALAPVVSSSASSGAAGGSSVVGESVEPTSGAVAVTSTPTPAPASDVSSVP